MAVGLKPGGFMHFPISAQARILESIPLAKASGNLKSPKQPVAPGLYASAGDPALPGHVPELSPCPAAFCFSAFSVSKMWCVVWMTVSGLSEMELIPF